MEELHEDTVKREADKDDSECGDDINEQGQEEVSEDSEGVQLFAGQAHLGWRNKGETGKTEKRRKKKRKKIDKETKEILRRQEVSNKN